MDDQWLSMLLTSAELLIQWYETGDVDDPRFVCDGPEFPEWLYLRLKKAVHCIRHGDTVTITVEQVE